MSGTFIASNAKCPEYRRVAVFRHECSTESRGPLRVSQMASRHDKGDTLSLNEYLSQWSQEKGWILTDDFIKYYFYGESTFETWFVIRCCLGYGGRLRCLCGAFCVGRVGHGVGDDHKFAPAQICVEDWRRSVLAARPHIVRWCAMDNGALAAACHVCREMIIPLRSLRDVGCIVISAFSTVSIHKFMYCSVSCFHLHTVDFIAPPSLSVLTFGVDVLMLCLERRLQLRPAMDCGAFGL